MAKVIDINQRNQALVEQAKIKTMRALGSIRGVGELSRGYLPLNETQVNKIVDAMESEVRAAGVQLRAALNKNEGAQTVNFDL